MIAYVWSTDKIRSCVSVHEVPMQVLNARPGSDLEIIVDVADGAGIVNLRGLIVETRFGLTPFGMWLKGAKGSPPW